MLAHSLLLLGCGSLVAAKSQLVGMNIAGFEFGCEITGTCPLTTIHAPNEVALAQMTHFVEDDNMNIFRLPVSWQYLVDNKIGPLSANFDIFDAVVQDCLSTGAYCVIDVHNFARYDGKIIGQGGPTNAEFADLWTQLATKYKKESKMVFGLMNEPWELDVPLWADTVQAAVTAIRKAGAATQMILLPGTNFASAGKLVSSGSGDALLGVKNPDGTTDGLILDLHKYLDKDNSGTFTECVTDNIADAFAIVAPYLRKNKRLAIVSETGAPTTTDGCFTDFCAQNTYLNMNASDVILGYIAWGAGTFDSDYILSLTPTDVDEDGKLEDVAMVSKCVVGPWMSAGPATAKSTKTSTSTGTKATSTSTSGGVDDSTVTTTAKKSAVASTSTIGASASTPTSAASLGFDMGIYKWALPVTCLLALVF